MRHLSRTTFPSEICWALTFNCFYFIFPWDTSSFEVLKITKKFDPFLKRKQKTSRKLNLLFIKMFISNHIPKSHKTLSLERALWHNMLLFVKKKKKGQTVLSFPFSTLLQANLVQKCSQILLLQNICLKIPVYSARHKRAGTDFASNKVICKWY